MACNYSTNPTLNVRMLLMIGCLLAGCSVRTANFTAMQEPRLATAKSLIDAFYSFDPVKLWKATAGAPGSMPDILYYQGWAEGGNYRVLDRQPCRFDKADEVSCPVTVKDDLVPALGSAFRVTDVFHLAFRDGQIVRVWNSSDDPPEFDQAMKWLRRERPEVFAGPCRKMFAGGPTPSLCVRSIVKGFADFSSRQASQ